MSESPKFAIFTAGRTGSQIIARNLSDYYNCEQYIPEHDKVSLGVLHSHYALWEPPDPGWVCILSMRKNDFEAMCSNYIAKKTQEFIEYSDILVEPFDVSYADFEMYFGYRKMFYQAVDTSKFSKTITVWYEDLITDHSHLFGQLELDLKTDLSVLSKSPYNYRKIIKNWEQALGWYNHLHANWHPTPDEIESWKLSTRKYFLNKQVK